MVADKSEYSNPRDMETIPLNTPLELFGEEVSNFFLSFYNDYWCRSFLSIFELVGCSNPIITLQTSV